MHVSVIGYKVDKRKFELIVKEKYGIILNINNQYIGSLFFRIKTISM